MTAAAQPPTGRVVDRDAARARPTVERYVLAVRLLGQLGRHRDAVELGTEGLERFPLDARLLRWRGEARLVLGDVGAALGDLTAAARGLADEPDHDERARADVGSDIVDLLVGRPPDAPGADRTTTETNGGLRAITSHHLGIARYLVADFAGAAEAFAEPALLDAGDRLRLAAADWRYLALRRAGREPEAGEHLRRLDLAVWPNPTGVGAVAQPSVLASLADCYRQRLGMYRGEFGPEVLLRNDRTGPLAVATLGAGVGTWYLLTGRPAAATTVWRRVVELGEPASTGYLVAVAELARQ